MKKINLKVYFKKRKQRLSFFGVSPQFDWKVIVSLVTLLLVCGIGLAVYLYIQVNNGSLFEIVEDTSIETELNTKRLKIEKRVEFLNQKSFDESVAN
jgi:hypothetical protein